MKKTTTVLVILFIVIIFQFCSKKDAVIVTTPPSTTALTPTLPATIFNYNTNFPAHILAALIADDNTPANNPITNDGATLGRVLFYDKKLSKNNTVSCGSCHKQEFSFDDNIALSKGFEGGFTDRNSMAILNIRFYKSGKMFWDERATTVEKQALQPIQNHVEMGLTLAELETKVKELSYYTALFQNAFGSTIIDSVKIARALSQFERSIVTYQSKYDRVKQGQENFTTAEAQGELLFNTAPPPPPGGGANPPSCNGCHTAPMFINSAAPPFGFPDLVDLGISNLSKFKSGSLRNIANRTSLFHNGSVTNLQSMFAAGAPGSGTQPIPAHAANPQNAANLIAFMNTLTDNTILTDPKFSDPFK
ncbi:MAG: cytochrome-c peroxidase [Ferruginibacter sp.]|nr:cytochrome-c peroxidase [Ferruginibacter sp.]